MKNSLKNKVTFIVILFVSLILPFRVEAKKTNTFIEASEFDNNELISGDTIQIEDGATYIPVDEQNVEIFYINKITNFEYYIIDSIDSKGNIKYKKYNFSDSNKSVWYPGSSSLFSYSGSYADFDSDKLEFYNVCKNNREWFDQGTCNVILPAVNGKIARWRFDGVDYGDAVDVDACEFNSDIPFTIDYYGSCDYNKNPSAFISTYLGTYKYYTSYTYKFYEIPDEQPKLKVMCDTNELKNGETSECKVSFSYKYNLSSIVFDITSDKLIIDDFQSNNGWNVDYTDDGVSLNYLSDRLTNAFVDDTEIATFKIVADDNVDDILASLQAIDFRYIDKAGESTLDDFNLDFDLEKDKADDDNKDSNNIIGDIINPNTFRDNYYLITGILVIAGISFIQIKSRRKVNKL